MLKVGQLSCGNHVVQLRWRQCMDMRGIAKLLKLIETRGSLWLYQHICNHNAPTRTADPYHLRKDSRGSHEMVKAVPGHHDREALIRERKGFSVWLVPATQAVNVPPDIEHEVYFPGNVSLRNLFFDPSVVQRLPSTCLVVRVSSLLRQLILRAVAIGDSYRRGTAEWRLMQVVVDEVGFAEPSALELPMARDERLQRVIDALLKAPADPRRVDAWASVASMSSRHFSRCFVAETGLTFAQWRLQLRLLRAIEYLGRGESVTETASALGYESLSAFVEMFRTPIGQSPGQFKSEAGNGRTIR